MKTVAIVGAHIGTREDAPWYQYSTTIWVFNEHASLGWPKRVDAVFQMHADPVWKNPLNRNDTGYAAWMREEHAFPVFMQDEHPEVPSSVRYPLVEICEEYLPWLTKGGQPHRYFTSTVAYALALAIYQGYERIELFGVEMESNTEYTYQRDGVFFWIGIAIGRGIEVEIHPKSGLFAEPLYGYEGDVSLERKHFHDRIALLTKFREKAETDLEDANTRQGLTLDFAMSETGGEPGMSDVGITRQYFASIKAQAQAIIDLGMFEGALSECERYLHKADVMEQEAGEYIFARQEFELTGAQALDLRDQREAHMQVAAGEATTAWKALHKAVQEGMDQTGLLRLSEAYAKGHEDYLKVAFEFGRLSGIYQENVTLLAKVDELIKAAGGEKAAEALMIDRENGRKTKRGKRKKAEAEAKFNA